MQRALPQPVETPKVEPSPPAANNGIGSWALPKYEVTLQPVEKKDDVPSVKVSLPNLVREELLLSPDHAEQEVHLLMTLFIPGQETLTTPDPQPAIAVLNFHTIAVMVIEAFVQFEIGDEMSLGPPHLRGLALNKVDDEMRIHDAKDADVDEIFFAVIDRWRAGMASSKENLSMIRGVQEFCDVALDVIYYIKENGLFKPEPKKRAKSAKATKAADKQDKETVNAKGKGKMKANAEDTASNAKKGVKRPAPPKVNELQAKKKAKVTKAPATKASMAKAKASTAKASTAKTRKAPPKTKPKAKSSGVSVINRK